MTKSISQKIKTLLEFKKNEILQCGKFKDCEKYFLQVEKVIKEVRLPTSSKNKVINDIFSFWASFSKQNPFSKSTLMQNLFELYLLSDFEKIYFGEISDSLMNSNGEAIAKGGSENSGENFQNAEEMLEKLSNMLQLQNLIEIQMDLKNEDLLDMFALANDDEGKERNTSEEEIEKKFKEIQKNKKILEFAEKIGRHERPPLFYTPSVSYDGIHFSNDIKNTLASEIALHQNDKTKMEFLRRYAQKELQCYRPGPDSELNRRRKNKGPVILCLDTSSSMQGDPEILSKAMCLLMTKTVSRKHREILIINFSVDFKTIRLEKESSSKMLKKLMDFLKVSFDGGTEIGPAFENAFKVLDENAFQDADILVISDFVTRPLSEESIENIKKAKENKTRFFALCINGRQEESINEELKSLMDEWMEV